MKTSYVFFIFLFAIVGRAQDIPITKVIPIDSLSYFLKDDVKKEIARGGEISEASLAKYFRENFSERYFYDWHSVDERFTIYNKTYENQSSHYSRAKDHMDKYADSTNWILPFNYLNGNEVDAYALRHLSRQHKMVDIAYQYFYTNKDPIYIDYFTNQMSSLNRALELGAYEKIEDGNGVYEAFRSGYRILNWLQIHNMFLGQDNYSDDEQLQTVATLLQHGAHLYERNQKFHSGNHQTRGLSALAMVSILLRDFEGTDIWYSHAMELLEEHLSEEINDDGFQFERTVHYHMSDIGNFYYVYQLAKNSNLEVNEFWENKLNSLFTTLIKIGYPDKSAPVLSDDTDAPWAEKNDISGAMTLGYLLFEDAEMGYFANNHVEAKMFWYLSDAQLEMLHNIKAKKPAYKSLDFPTTGYYIMRDGWNAKDHMMIISAGLDDLKPDHQHGDMLGIQAMANGKVVLPNYQVRYYLKDLELFKNSLTKNVALVDKELQGKQYTSNKGGSGFGKFKELPNPKVISWSTSDEMDVFVGTHDGFEHINTDYTRQVIYIKNDFWIVKDNFQSDTMHEYKQVWQGHFSHENAPNLIRTTFDDGSGLDIYQLIETDNVTNEGRRGKEWSIVSKNKKSDFSFISIVYPFSTFDKRVDEDNPNPDLKGWKVNDLSFQATGVKMSSLSKQGKAFLFNVNEILINGVKINLSLEADVFVEIDHEAILVHSIGDKELSINVSGARNNKIETITFDKEAKLKPGNLLECRK